MNRDTERRLLEKILRILIVSRYCEMFPPKDPTATYIPPSEEEALEYYRGIPWRPSDGVQEFKREIDQNRFRMMVDRQAHAILKAVSEEPHRCECGAPLSDWCPACQKAWES